MKQSIKKQKLEEVNIKIKRKENVISVGYANFFSKSLMAIKEDELDRLLTKKKKIMMS